MSLLAERLLLIHRSFVEAGIPHAFGGAIALAYCTGEPRATQDLDVNVFVDLEQCESVLAALPGQVELGELERAQIQSTGQTRAFWAETPIDLFFNTVPFHQLAEAAVACVPFSGEQIPVLDCTSLAVFKAMFNRTKDWADLEAMHEVGELDARAVEEHLVAHLGAEDPRIQRLRSVAIGPSEF